MLNLDAPIAQVAAWGFQRGLRYGLLLAAVCGAIAGVAAGALAGPAAAARALVALADAHVVVGFLTFAVTMGVCCGALAALSFVLDDH